MTRGVIDIGTNTCHLLIAEVKGDKIRKILFKKRFYTFLGEEGLDKICSAALNRLWSALDFFLKKIEIFECARTQVVATESLRSAQNGPAIRDRIVSEYGWPIDIIDGDQEASLIYLGIKQSIDLRQGKFLIMDIGGGSVEFIAVGDGKKLFQMSFPIGISRLYHRFHVHDPCAKSDLEIMNEFLNQQLTPLWLAIGRPSGYQLVGCAGTFEIFLKSKFTVESSEKFEKIKSIGTQELLSKVQTLQERDRARLVDIPEKRSQYIVVALSLINHVSSKLDSDYFLVSKFSLKEGIIVCKKYF